MLTKNQVKALKSLQQKLNRKETRQYIAEGFKMVDEALLAENQQVLHLYLLLDHPKKEYYQQLCESKNVAFSEISGNELQQISSLQSPQEIMVLLKIPAPIIPRTYTSDTIILALDDVKDPGNLGTIIRICDWYGIESIVCSQSTVDAYNPKVVQASMGSIFRVQLIYTDLQAFFKESKLPVYGTMLDGKNIYEEKLQSPGILLMGNESLGISPALRNAVNFPIYLPAYNTHKGAESLNVAIACAVACTIFRQPKI